MNTIYVVINRKTTKFESNSQLYCGTSRFSSCCYQSQNYKIWKQFTTQKRGNEKTSQLLSIAKLQNLKAIHNKILLITRLLHVVINRKTTKFESNSQLVPDAQGTLWGCYQSQNYKIWKQFTTFLFQFLFIFKLLSIAKLQNLKAIHNLNLFLKTLIQCCYQSQNYKIWKQFTTEIHTTYITFSLLSIAKLQNLKAIHNCYWIDIQKSFVVINRKTTKFESNSQRVSTLWISEKSCYQSQNYKIWKQFTTGKKYEFAGLKLLSIAKLQNLKAIHNIRPGLVPL